MPPAIRRNICFVVLLVYQPRLCNRLRRDFQSLRCVLGQRMSGESGSSGWMLLSSVNCDDFPFSFFELLTNSEIQSLEWW